MDARSPYPVPPPGTGAEGAGPSGDEALARAVDCVTGAVADPRQGLGEPVFLMVSRLTPLVNVDLLIRDEAGRLLLTWRDDQFCGSGWHIPGGIIRFKERWEHRIAEVARLELGATVEAAPVPLVVRQAVHPDRDTRGHFVSLLFACSLTSAPDPARCAAGVPRIGDWAWFDACPDDLIGVHRRLYGDILS